MEIRFGSRTRVQPLIKVPVKAAEFIDNQKREMWVREKEIKVLNFYHPQKPILLIDVFVNEPIDYEILEDAKEVMQAGRIKIPVVSSRHLIELKKYRIDLRIWRISVP
jgi:hypothetical protein